MHVKMNMINGTILCLLLNILFLFSCTRYASLETALSQSYGNRSELEKVLTHYQYDESKYRAVCYLIEICHGKEVFFIMADGTNRRRWNRRPSVK